jgi:TRAP-type C4-dicarboxylate transport system permease small subunit
LHFASTFQTVLILLKTTCQSINRGVEILLGTLGISMTFIVGAQVFYRYVLNDSLFWSEELARYLLVWISFLGATTAYYRGVHPGVDILIKNCSTRFKWYGRMLVHFLSALLFIVITWAGIQFAYFVRIQISPALGVHKWLILAIIPISGAVLTIYALTFFLTTMQKMERMNNGQ